MRFTNVKTEWVNQMLSTKNVIIKVIPFYNNWYLHTFFKQIQLLTNSMQVFFLTKLT